MKLTAKNLLDTFKNYDAGTRNPARYLDEKIAQYLIDQQLIDDAAFAGIVAMSKKPTGKTGFTRTAQMLNFVATKDIKNCDKAIAFAAMVVMLNPENKSLTFDDAKSAVSGKGHEHTKPIDNVPVSKLRTTLGLIFNRDTAATQLSRTVGANGLFANLKITEKVGQHEFKIKEGAHQNHLLNAYCKALASLPEGELIAHMNKGAEQS